MTHLRLDSIRLSSLIMWPVMVLGIVVLAAFHVVHLPTLLILLLIATALIPVASILMSKHQDHLFKRKKEPK